MSSYINKSIDDMSREEKVRIIDYLPRSTFVAMCINCLYAFCPGADDCAFCWKCNNYYCKKCINAMKNNALKNGNTECEHCTEQDDN